MATSSEFYPAGRRVVEAFSSRPSFDDFLMTARRINQSYTSPEVPELTPDTWEREQIRLGPFFAVAVDSGWRGSKTNAYHVANGLGIPCVEKLFIGTADELARSKQEPNADIVVKPLNLNSSTGLLILKDGRSLLGGEKYPSTGAALRRYVQSEAPSHPAGTEYLMEPFLAPEDGRSRPDQIACYSFNGETPLVRYIRWASEKNQVDAWITEDGPSWQSSPPGGELTSRRLEQVRDAAEEADKLTALIGTFMRVDFIYDPMQERFLMNETSGLPFCGFHRVFRGAIDDLLRPHWRNCFPFNSPLYQTMLERSKDVGATGCGPWDRGGHPWGSKEVPWPAPPPS